MREIKFRAWDGEQIVYPDYIDRKGIAHWTENSIPETSDKVMQYTGLKDKNGVDIFEGDVVKCYYGGSEKGAHDTIEFKNGAFCLRHRGVTIKEMLEDDGVYSSELEIIGNIYSNPELLIP